MFAGSSTRAEPSTRINRRFTAMVIVALLQVGVVGLLLFPPWDGGDIRNLVFWVYAASLIAIQLAMSTIWYGIQAITLQTAPLTDEQRAEVRFFPLMMTVTLALPSSVFMLAILYYTVPGGTPRAGTIPVALLTSIVVRNVLAKRCAVMSDKIIPPPTLPTCPPGFPDK